MSAAYEFAIKEGDISDMRTKDAAVIQHVQGGARQQDVRRPLRGIQVKGDTFATMSVFNGTGVAKKLANSSVAVTSPGDVGNADYTSNFILTGSSEERSEKFQSVSTFGAAYGFFFGEQPRFVNYQAVLMNTADFQWELEWWHNYENVLRGTKLVEQRARVYLYYDEVTVEGYIIRAQTQKVATTPYEVALNFTMWVTNVQSVQTAGATMDSRVSTGKAFETGGVQSTTTRVRAENIKAYTDRKAGAGLLGALRTGLNAVTNWTGQVGAKIDDAQNFLYGRTLVIPMGFAGSERYSGEANFANLDAETGAKLKGLLGDFTKGSVTIRLPAPMALPADPTFTQYHDNYDEYVNRENDPELFDRATAAAKALHDTEEWRDFARTEADSVAKAEAMFAANGIIVSNKTGTESSILMDIVGRATFGVVSFVAASKLAGHTPEKAAAAKLEKEEELAAAREEERAERLAMDERQVEYREKQRQELADAWDEVAP